MTTIEVMTLIKTGYILVSPTMTVLSLIGLAFAGGVVINLALKGWRSLA